MVAGTRYDTEPQSPDDRNCEKVVTEYNWHIFNNLTSVASNILSHYIFFETYLIIESIKLIIKVYIYIFVG